MEIHESDWRVFRHLHSIALERFSQRALQEIREAADCNGDYHDCYRKVYRLVRSHDKRMAAAFDGPSRSNAFVLLANIIGEGLLTEEELEQFSLKAQTHIKIINKLRRT